jgi:hypothetical protein
MNNYKNNIRLLFCGDFIAEHPEKIELSNEFKELLESCDVKSLNFEGPLPIGNPIAIKGTAVLPQSNKSPFWCEENGFNVISLANNHMGDYGQDALKDTINAFKSATIVGAGTWEEAFKVKVVEVKGFKIGFLAVAQCEFGILNDAWGENNSFGCAWVNHPNINKIIKEAKKSLDFLIVISHAGIEYCDFPLPEWRDRYKELIDCGADAIIGGHPHVPQGWEVYNNKPIFYSLGNFYFEYKSSKPFWNNGLAVVLNIDENKNISFEVINTIKDNNLLKINRDSSMIEHNKKICEILSNQNQYINEVNKFCLKLWSQYEGALLIGLNAEKSNLKMKNIAKFIVRAFKGRKPEPRTILNMIRCESHRYTIVRAIKLITNVKI